MVAISASPEWRCASDFDTNADTYLNTDADTYANADTNAHSDLAC